MKQRIDIFDFKGGIMQPVLVALDALPQIWGFYLVLLLAEFRSLFPHSLLSFYTGIR